MNSMVNLRRMLLVFVLSFLILGCNEIRLIGAYDENVDNGIQAVSKDITVIFVQVDKNIDDGSDWSYKSFKSQYVALETELGVLTIRAKALPKYSIIRDQLTILTDAIQKLEKEHNLGFVAPGVPKEQLKKAIAIDKSGIEVAIGAMLALQEGLKRTPVDKPKSK